MKKLQTAILAITMMLSIAFVGGSISSTGHNAFSVSAQTVSVRRTRRPGAIRSAYRGGRWVVRRTWDGTKWVSRKVWIGTRWTGRQAWRGTRKVGRTIKRAVY